MLSKDQNQHVEEHGTAVQAQGDISMKVFNVGLNYSQAKEIFDDLFELNFYKLKGAAKEVVDDRAKEITVNFLEKLKEEYPAGLQQSANPDFQDALFGVQKEHAKAGDKELGDLLVDLLVDRAKQGTRNILQIVLNESLRTAPKLTNDQIAVLSAVFFLRYVRNAGIGNHQRLHEFLAKHLDFLVGKMIPSKSCFQHLEYTACGSNSMGQISLEEIFQRTYPGLFNNGIERAQVNEMKFPDALSSRLLIPCINDPIKLQVNALDLEALEGTLAQLGENSVSVEHRGQIISLFNQALMSTEEIRVKVTEFSPFMEPIFASWAASGMKSFELTSVGMAIGHANIKRHAGEFSDLSIWIN